MTVDPPPTARIKFRRMVPSDVELLLVLNADEGVMRYLDWHPPSREVVEREVQATIDAYSRWPGYGTFIAESHDGEFLGWFQLMVKNDNPASPELGYRLRRHVWGAGLATEGSQALIAHAFTRLGVDQVEAETMFVNTASRRVMEKCGMTHVETFHVHFDDPLPGTEHGEVRYVITRDEWQRGRHGATAHATDPATTS